MNDFVRNDDECVHQIHKY